MMLSSEDDESLVAKTDRLLAQLDLGAEPFWMQDIRCAQRAIECARRARSNRSDQAASDSDSADNLT